MLIVLNIHRHTSMQCRFEHIYMNSSPVAPFYVWTTIFTIQAQKYISSIITIIKLSECNPSDSVCVMFHSGLFMVCVGMGAILGQVLFDFVLLCQQRRSSSVHLGPVQSSTVHAQWMATRKVFVLQQSRGFIPSLWLSNEALRCLTPGGTWGINQKKV